MVDANSTRIILEAEVKIARDWAARNGIQFEWLPEVLEIRVELRQGDSQERFYLKGQFPDYRELPPKWFFVDCSWSETTERVNAPRGVQTRFGPSIFNEHNLRPVICAHFNRLAYQQEGGLHQDWTDEASWLSIGGQYVRATNLAEMLQIIVRDFRYTNERLAA